MTLPSTLSMISLPSPQHPFTPRQPRHYLCPQVYFLQEAGSFFKTSGKSGAPGKAENTTGSAIRTSRLGGGRGLVLPGKSVYCTAHNTALQESAFPSPAHVLLCEHYLLTFCSSFKTLFSSALWGLTVGTVVSSYLHFQSTPNPLVCGKYTFYWSLYMLFSLPQDLELLKSAGCLARFRVPSLGYVRFSQLLASGAVREVV